MNKYILLSLSVIAGIISGLAWTDWCPGLVLLFSMSPFLIVEDHMFRNRFRYSFNDLFVYILPGILIFNLIALGWTRAAGIIAAITIITGLSAIMTLVILLAHIIRVKAGTITGIFSIITLWLSFELLSLHTDFLSPWMNLGNGLAKEIQFIQWYEVTGVAGGTLWILVSNLIFGAFLISFINDRKRMHRLLTWWILVFTIPIVISLTRYYTIKSTSATSGEVVIIQPNADPYTKKYSIPFEDQLNRVVSMAADVVSDSTSWVVAPETMIDDPVNEADGINSNYISSLRKFAGSHPKASIIAGMVTYKISRDKGFPDTVQPDIAILPEVRQYYNSAIRIDSGITVNIYHKSKLVAGIEKEFSASFGRLVNKVIPDYYGTGWGYGIQEKREVFRHHLTGHSIAPVICYESVFGNYVADYVRQGAEALFIITNDGWWKNTIGYKQHLSFASLRAIETRRPIARAANTGISCFIDIRGNRISDTEWWDETTLKGTIKYETIITPYLKYGDFIMRFSAVIALFITLYVFITLLARKKFHNPG